MRTDLHEETRTFGANVAGIVFLGSGLAVARRPGMTGMVKDGRHRP
jgi:hypothetical protein